MTWALDRRELLGLGLTGAGLASLPTPLLAGGVRGFTHSVASGEPGQASITLWTRYVSPDASTRLRVEVASDPAFRRIVARAETVAAADRDHAAKVVATGLNDGRTYYYRFIDPSGQRSVTGRTRTLPAGPVDRYRIAVFSCANATSGWFNAYAHAAARNDLDLALHLGDYIYESRTDREDALPELARTRAIRPLGEALHLADYRARYASYRSDPDLAALHCSLPVIVMPDDHEIANNAWVGGAAGHSSDEGDWSVRRAAGLRAFAEWLPVSNAPWQQYRIGNLATLFRVDTRYTARDRPLNVRWALKGASDRKAALRSFATQLRHPHRTLMGPAQEKWLSDGFSSSRTAGIPWQVLAQQVVMGPTRLPSTADQWLGPGERPSSEEQEALADAIALAEVGLPLGLDRWDGYPAARERLLASARAAGANLVVLTGDSHNGWAYELRAAGGPAGVEYAGQAVSSLGIEKRFGGDPTRIAADFLAANPALKWADTYRRGYMVLTITPDRVEADYVFLPSRSERSTGVLGTQKLVTERGGHAILRS